jgi:diacylglycerol kinase family enzyme
MRRQAVVVIVNPTKVDDLDEARRVVAEVAAGAGLDDPRWVETTEDDPGFGQARAALDGGAEVVCVLGGDGTVRAVAQELVGSGVPLGLLPAGTGNLLARNVGTPVDDLSEAVEVALTGTGRVIDVGWLVLQPRAEQHEEDRPAAADNVHAFVVMAGLGFDADMMEDAPEGVKAKVGWAAYVASGARHLTDEGFGLDVVVDGEPSSHGSARTVVVGNCGELTGGMVLLPDAELDDGLLDVATLTPTAIKDWAGVAARVLGGRDDGPSLDRRQGRRVLLRAEPPQRVEVDGDVLEGVATEVLLVVEPGGLTVRVSVDR